ncbi:MAG: NnrS family protein [Xanthomonadaceae bacterium]|nr:NnrS family protein [Xanthomonadaceae bacterium]
MNSPSDRLSISLPVLARAPHRLLFLIGALNVLAAMAWWTAWLVAMRWQLFSLPQPPIPAGWAHAIVMPYQVLAPFMFGFLLTVFPRWMGQPDMGRWHYLPVGLGLLGGQALTLIGLWGFAHLLHLGALFTLAGWLSGMASLLGVLWRESGRTWHAVSAWLALAMGLLGFALYAVWLHVPSQVLLPFAAIKLGLIGFALPVYVTVCHRMVPFFASRVVAGYRVWRPMWLLAAMWLLIAAHLWLELSHVYAWLWLADLPLTGLFAWMLWRWWPRAAMPGLLRVLFIGLTWLPVAFALYSAQSLWLLVSDQFALGRAPSHALAVGFFGSLLVAMVTRVTQGHSGRPLHMTAPAWFAFALIQGVALIRVFGELGNDGLAWQAAAGLGWLIAFGPWALRSAWLYLTPRADGGAG